MPLRSRKKQDDDALNSGKDDDKSVSNFLTSTNPTLHFSLNNLSEMITASQEPLEKQSLIETIPSGNTLKATSFHEGNIDSTQSSFVSAATSMGASFIPSAAEPLTWREARKKLKQVLQEYLDCPSPKPTDLNVKYRSTQSRISGDGHVEESRVHKWIRWWFDKDLDCYLGSILISAVLLLISIMFYITDDKYDVPGPIRTLHKSHIAVAVFFLLGSILSIYLIELRRTTTSQGVETKKRHIIEAFLPILTSLEQETKQEESAKSEEKQSYEHLEEVITKSYSKGIPGTSLTDVYPCYRLSPDGDGQWISISSLLLVEGDFVALQLGDAAPADCQMLTGATIGLTTSASSELQRAQSQPNLHQNVADTIHKRFQFTREPIQINAGERVESLPKRKGESQSQRLNAQLFDPLFHSGKSSLPRHSRKLLHLNNHMRIFQLNESPIESFLKKECVPHTTPQLHRQLRSIRITLYVFSIIILFLSFIAIFIRLSTTKVNFRQTMTLPLFASLSTLPVASPLILILLEICGTSRILITVHRYSNLTQKTSSRVGLFLRYIVRGLYSRIRLRCFHSSKVDDSGLIDFPIASSALLEKLGVVTVLAVVDDELACDPNSIPQQLLIPTNKGLKLLDLFPKYDDEDMDDDSEDDEFKESKRLRAGSAGSYHDSDSDWGDTENPEEKHGYNRRLKVLAKMRKRYRNHGQSMRKTATDNLRKANVEVMFEDPTWWHHLPSLKCIGLTSLLVDDTETEDKRIEPFKSTIIKDKRFVDEQKYIPGMAELALTYHISKRYKRSHMKKLAYCIGFTTEPNSFGEKGDITPFVELRRIRIIASRLQHQRILLDRHQISLEESRSWGMLKPDAVSVIIEDMRSNAYQLLTVGDARLITEFCSDSWIGEDSTITPLSQSDKRTILDTSKVWSLADLDVQAFSYAPLPVSKMSKDHNKLSKMNYLLDNRISCHVPSTIHKDHGSEDWSLLKNQFFIGLLGSAAIPRRDIAPLIDDCSNAGVRFVYFSPRNMRRTKELAGQMSIDISWNCAISLRPLDEGEREDKHRMLSEYADWDVNAKLPHGVKDVKKHLKEVDNVPLLVSLYTDATKESTCEMVKVFKEYHDTVLSVGLAHVSKNDDTFSNSDLAFSYDLSSPEDEPMQDLKFSRSIHPEEVSFVSRIASHSCVFHLTLGEKGLLNMNDIIAKGRAARISVKNAGIFCVSATIAFALGIFISTLTVLVSVPMIPGTAVLLYHFVIIPMITLSMAFTAQDEHCMVIVPPKNDVAVTFGKGERRRMTEYYLLKAIVPATASYISYLISFGSIAVEFDADKVNQLCGLDDASQSTWTDVVTCRGLQNYVGSASLPASSLMVTELAFCMIIQSMTFLSGNAPVFRVNPFRKNIVWVIISLSSIVILIIYLLAVLEDGILSAIPWYFYVLAVAVFPTLSLLVAELVKKRAKRFEERAEKLRRLQFETRLGMWSPK